MLVVEYGSCFMVYERIPTYLGRISSPIYIYPKEPFFFKKLLLSVCFRGTVTFKKSREANRKPSLHLGQNFLHPPKPLLHRALARLAIYFWPEKVGPSAPRIYDHGQFLRLESPTPQRFHGWGSDCKVYSRYYGQPGIYFRGCVLCVYIIICLYIWYNVEFMDTYRKN